MEPQTQDSTFKPKLGKNFLSCFVLLILSGVVCIFLFAFLLAKSGLVTVPFISRLYHGPIPTRSLNAPPVTMEDFKVLIESRFKAQAIAGKLPPYSVSVSEEELSGVMETSVRDSINEKGWKQLITQVTIQPTHIEFFGKFVRGIWHVDIIAFVKPLVKDGGVSFELLKVQIGDYVVPNTIAEQIMSVVFSRDIGTFFLGFSGARLQNISLQEGSARIVVAPHL